MECCSSDYHSSYIYCFQIRYRCYGSCATDRMFYRDHFRTYLLGWELIRDRIAWMMLCAPKIIPKRHIIEFEYHTIDIEIEMLLSILSFIIDDLDKGLKSRNNSKWKILTVKTPRRKKIHESIILHHPMMIILILFNLWYRVCKELKFPTSSHEWIQLTKRS